jgi:glycosyltransferase involved in cell wall biosynthesis
MSVRPLTVAMVAAMPFPMAKASSIRVGHLVHSLSSVHEDVRVELFAYRGGPTSDPGQRVMLHLVAGFDASKARYYSWRNKLVADFSLIGAMWRRRRAIDIVHCHTIEGLGVALAFKLLTLSRAPICADLHGPIVEELVHYRLIPSWRPILALAAWLERLMLKAVRHVFVSNEGLKDLLARRVGDAKVSVVFDYVDPDAFATDRLDPAEVEALRRRWKPGGERLVTYLGMFKDYQGVDYLIRAFAELVRRFPDVRLMLVGDGPCRRQYETLIAELGIGDSVLLPGLVPHDEVAPYLAISDVVVSPRIDNAITRAGFVSQMPEYMAAGRLIVSTWVSGCRYLLRDGAGILVEPNNVASLREGLEKALTLSPAEAAGLVERARSNVAQFVWQRGITDVLRVYLTLIGVAAG